MIFEKHEMGIEMTFISFPWKWNFEFVFLNRKFRLEVIYIQERGILRIQFISQKLFLLSYVNNVAASAIRNM